MRQQGIVGIFVLILVLVIVVAGGAYYLKAYERKFCGGFASNLPENQCPLGYTCKPDFPQGNDISGKCESILGSFLKLNPYMKNPNSQLSPSTSPSVQSSLPSDTTDWKTYTNTDGKYSIKYPNGYYLEEATFTLGHDKLPLRKEDSVIRPSDDGLNPFYIDLSYYSVPDISRANEVLEEVRTCDKGNKAKDFIIDNQKAIMYEDSGCAQFGATHFYILHNDRVYSISVESAEQYHLHKARVEKILSTFRFTSQ